MKEISKEEILQAIEIFGLNVDLDNWDNDHNKLQFIRVNHLSSPILEPLLIFRKDYKWNSLEDAIPYSLNDLYYQLQEYLKRIGELQLKIKINNLITI